MKLAVSNFGTIIATNYVINFYYLTMKRSCNVMIRQFYKLLDEYLCQWNIFASTL